MAGFFAAAVRKFTERTKRQLDEVTRESVRLLYYEVIRNAPEDTGYLRASVKLSTGAPLPPEQNPPDRGVRYTYDPTTALAALAGARKGDRLFLNVTASYARHVEYGTSRQAPTAFLRRAEMSWPRLVEQAIANVRNGG